MSLCGRSQATRGKGMASFIDASVSSSFALSFSASPFWGPLVVWDSRTISYQEICRKSQGGLQDFYPLAAYRV